MKNSILLLGSGLSPASMPVKFYIFPDFSSYCLNLSQKYGTDPQSRLKLNGLITLLSESRKENPKMNFIFQGLGSKVDFFQTLEVERYSKIPNR